MYESDALAHDFEAGAHPLTAGERELGWVEHHCDEHGFLVACTPKAKVSCKCGRISRILRHGRIVNGKTLRPTDAKPRTVKANGDPYLYACGDCGEDFGGKELLARHRAGRGQQKRCRSPHEMIGKGWHKDSRGRWRVRGSKSPDNTPASTVQEVVEAVFSPSEPANDLGHHPNLSGLTFTVHGESDESPEPWSNPTRNWKRGTPGSRNGETAGRGGGGPREGFVYFFQGDTTRRIKIGFSSDPERRLEEIRRGASERMRLLGSVAGSTGDEARHHRACAGAWVLNEWFSDDVLPDVAQVLDVSVSDIEAVPFS